MERKENDWLLTNLDNIGGNYTNTDYKNVGIDANNTELLSSDIYKKQDVVKLNKLFQTDGKFDDRKFDLFYNEMLVSYNDLSKDTDALDAMKSAIFFRDDIFAPASKREKGPEFSFSKVSNPDLATFGIVNPGRWEDPTLTPMEIAEQQKIFDPATNKFTDDTPENSLFKNFFKTIVIASYDSDGEHIDPLTGEKVQHRKGERKINPETGTYYTEFLNGRDLIGKEVVKKTDILTNEGSMLNGFDFFDSDGFTKSTVGTIARNAVMIAPMLIGGPISTVYVGASLGLSLMNLGATVNKMINGSDSAISNDVEGFVASLGNGVSQESLASTWTMENLINMAGHTFKFLYEMRFIGEKVPKLFKGTGVTPKDLEAMNKNIFDGILARDIKNGLLSPKLPTYAKIQADALTNNYVKSYLDLGQLISRSFMATTFGAETYNEAKAAGASDLEASAMTLASVGFQYGLLSSHVGNWIFPESKIENLTTKQAIDVISASRDLKEAASKLTGNKKAIEVNWFKNIMQKTKQFLQNNYDPTKNKISAASSMMLSAGTEMTSFELLHDISGTLFNFALRLNGKKIAKDPYEVKEGEITGFHPWENMVDRYASSFIGGAMGGLGIKPWIPILQVSKIKNMDLLDAHKYIIHLIKEGKEQLIVDTYNKMTLGSKTLSTKWNELAQAFEPTNEYKESQDYAAKLTIVKMVNTFKTLLENGGGTISEKALAEALTAANLDIGDIRFTALLNSRRISSYNKKLIDLDAEIIGNQLKIKDLTSVEGKEENNIKDNDKEGQLEINKLVAEISKHITELLKKKLEMLDGDTPFLTEAIFDMCGSLNDSFGLLNVQSWCKKEHYTMNLYNSSPSIQNKYRDYLKTNYDETFQISYDAFINTLKRTSPIISKLSSYKSGLESAYRNEAYRRLESDLNSGKEVSDENIYNSIIPIIVDSFDTSRKALYDDIVELVKIEQKYEELDDILKEEFNNTLNDLRQRTFDITGFNLAKAKASNLFEFLLRTFELSPELIQKMNDNNKISFDLVGRLYDFILESAGMGLRNFDGEELVSYADKESLKNSFLEFATEIFKDSNIDTKKLLTTISNSKNWEDIELGTLAQLDLVLAAAKMFSSCINAADTEAIDLITPYGFNLVYNKLNKTDLPELEHDLVVELSNNFNFIVDRLTYYRNMIVRAGAKKTAQLRYVQTAYQINNFKSHQQFCKYLKEVNSDLAIILENTLNNCNIISKDALNLTPELTKKAFEEFITVNDTVYDIINKLSDAEISSIFDKMDLVESVPTMEATLDMKKGPMDNFSYVRQLMTVGSLKASDFYSRYKTEISDNLAPLPILLDNIYTMVAGTAHYSKMHRIIDLYNSAFVKLYEPVLRKQFPEYNDAAIDFSVKNAPNYIKYENVFLTTGNPGTGKTLATIKLAINTIPKDSPILKNIAIVNKKSTEGNDPLKNAKDLASGLKIENATCFTHQSFLEKIINGYDPSKKYTSEDVIIVNGEAELKNPLSNTTDPYSIIIIDEATNITDIEWTAIRNYARVHNTLVYAAGDELQSGKNFKYTIKIGKNEIKMVSTLGPNLYIHGIRSIYSMRTGNNYNSKALEAFRLYVLGNDNKIETNWYCDDKIGLLGVANFERGNEDIYKQIILNMISVLLEENAGKDEADWKKIQYIYTDSKSETYKMIKELDNELQKYINFIQDSALGNENDFYIYDTSNTKFEISKSGKNDISLENFKKDVYTLITRASKGTLLIINDAGVNKVLSGITKSNDPALLEDNKRATTAWNNYSESFRASLKDIKGNEIKFDQIELKTANGTPAPAPLSTEEGIVDTGNPNLPTPEIKIVPSSNAPTIPPEVEQSEQAINNIKELKDSLLNILETIKDNQPDEKLKTEIATKKEEIVKAIDEVPILSTEQKEELKKSILNETAEPIDILNTQEIKDLDDATTLKNLNEKLNSESSKISDSEAIEQVITEIETIVKDKKNEAAIDTTKLGEPSNADENCEFIDITSTFNTAKEEENAITVSNVSHTPKVCFTNNDTKSVQLKLDLVYSEEKVTIPLFSFAAHEDGLIRNGEYYTIDTRETATKKSVTDFRIDGVYGIIDIIGLTKSGYENYNLKEEIFGKSDPDWTKITVLQKNKIDAIIAKVSEYTMEMLANPETKLEKIEAIKRVLFIAKEDDITLNINFVTAQDWANEENTNSLFNYNSKQEKNDLGVIKLPTALMNYKNPKEEQFVVPSNAGERAAETSRKFILVELTRNRRRGNIIEHTKIFSTPINRLLDPYSYLLRFYVPLKGIIIGNETLLPLVNKAIMEMKNNNTPKVIETENEIFNTVLDMLLKGLKIPSGFITFVKLFRLYRHSKNNTFGINDIIDKVFTKKEDGTIELTSFLAALSSKGEHYYGNEGLIYTMTDVDIAELYNMLDRTVSPVLVDVGKVKKIANIGWPFILIGPKYLSLEDLITKYKSANGIMDLLREGITIQSVIRPSVSAETYLRLICSILRGEKQQERYGDDTTSYKIFLILLDSDYRDTVKEHLDSYTGENKFNLLTKILEDINADIQNNGKTLVLALKEGYDGKSNISRSSRLNALLTDTANPWVSAISKENFTSICKKIDEYLEEKDYKIYKSAKIKASGESDLKEVANLEGYKLKNKVDSPMLILGNSSFIDKLYDKVFHTDTTSNNTRYTYLAWNKQYTTEVVEQKLNFSCKMYSKIDPDVGENVKTIVADNHDIEDAQKALMKENILSIKTDNDGLLVFTTLSGFLEETKIDLGKNPIIADIKLENGELKVKVKVENALDLHIEEKEIVFEVTKDKDSNYEISFNKPEDNLGNGEVEISEKTKQEVIKTIEDAKALEFDETTNSVEEKFNLLYEAVETDGREVFLDALDEKLLTEETVDNLIKLINGRSKKSETNCISIIKWQI